jgi:hypothetical protein
VSSPKLYTRDDLEAAEKATLETIAEARGVDGAGTGADGNVLVDDLVNAILADQDRTGLNPAVETEPEVLKPKRYRVTAPTAVFEHAPGEEFDEVIPPERERMLLEGGALSVVTPAKATPTPAAKAAPIPTTKEKK